MDKFESKKVFIPIVVLIILIIVVGAGYGVYKYFGPKTIFLPTGLSVKKESESVPKEPATINFSQSGNVLNWDSRTESYTEDWTLLYEEPGNPALSVKLVFDENSRCDVGEGEEVYDRSKLNNGDRAKIEGNKSDGEVTVVTLKKL
jgi:hypothetical protein